MTSKANGPLNPFRKNSDSPKKPLHSRWGDVSISVPTEGSWSQYDRQSHRRHAYGPGFIAEGPSSQRDILHSDCGEEEDINARPSRRDSLFINTFKPRRISMRLASPWKSSLDGERDREKENLLPDNGRTDFAYKPIRQDYTVEVAEKHHSTHNHSHGRGRAASDSSTRFRYIPSNARYREEFGEISPRSQSSVGSFCRGYRSPTLSEGRDDLDHEHDRGRKNRSRLSFRRMDSDESAYHYHRRDDRDRDRVSNPSERRRLGERRNTRYGSSARHMTTAMVPDSDDLYS